MCEIAHLQMNVQHNTPVYVKRNTPVYVKHSAPLHVKQHGGLLGFWLFDWFLSSSTDEGNICRQQGSYIPTHTYFKDKCYYLHDSLPLVRNQKYLVQLCTKERCLKKCKKKQKNIGSPDV